MQQILCEYLCCRGNKWTCAGIDKQSFGGRGLTMVEPLGTLKFAGCTLPITRASFGFVADGNNDPQSDEEIPGWDFDICAGPPNDASGDDSLRDLLSNGMRFYSESDPIPLENVGDL